LTQGKASTPQAAPQPPVSPGSASESGSESGSESEEEQPQPAKVSESIWHCLELTSSDTNAGPEANNSN
jgi:hypothetical protein